MLAFSTNAWCNIKLVLIVGNFLMFPLAFFLYYTMLWVKTQAGPAFSHVLKRHQIANPKHGVIRPLVF